jgi:hypothetical protein
MQFNCVAMLLEKAGIPDQPEMKIPAGKTGI